MRIGYRWLQWLSVSALTLMAMTAIPASAQLVAGKDYQVLKPAQPTTTGKNVEVIEFFWYGCPHCAHLQPSLHEWLKRKPADVTVRRQPAAFQDNWVQLARTYYTIEALDAVDKLHIGVFDAIHKTKTLNPTTLMKDQKPLFDWVATKGVNRQKFEEAYKSARAEHDRQTVLLSNLLDSESKPNLELEKIIAETGDFTATFTVHPAKRRL